MKKVLVTYPDNTTRETTISELREFFKEETKQWQANFFELLEETGMADGSFARYTLIED